MIVDPLRLLDCSRPTDGGAAIIVTSDERAADLTDHPVSVLGAVPHMRSRHGGKRRCSNR